MKLFYDLGSNIPILSYESIEKLGLTLSNETRSAETIGYGYIPIRYTIDYYVDLLFGPVDQASQSNSLLKLLGVPADGLVGNSIFQEKKCVEIDFINNRLCLTDSLPLFYVDNPDIQKAKIVRSDLGYENKLSKMVASASSIEGELVLADSIRIRTNFMFDNGMERYMSLSVMDSMLFKKLLDYKQTVIEKYGNNHPTTNLIIPELSIDTMMVRTRVFTYFQKNNVYKDAFGTAQVGGYLGFEFFLQYDKILFDWINRSVYFYKKTSKVK